MRKTGNYRWEDEKVEGKEVEVKQVSEREIWAGESRFYLGEDNIIYCTSVGGIDAEMAIAIDEATLKLMNMVEGKVNVLIDLTRTGQPTSEARKIGQQTFEHEKFGKVAMFGMHPVARVIASFIMGVTKKEDMHFFKTKEEALAWLKG